MVLETCDLRPKLLLLESFSYMFERTNLFCNKLNNAFSNIADVILQSAKQVREHTIN